MELKERLSELLLGSTKENEIIDSIASESKEMRSEIQEAYKKLIPLCFTSTASELAKKTGIKPVLDDEMKNIISKVYSRIIPKGDMTYAEQIYEFTKIKPEFNKLRIKKICFELIELGYRDYAKRLVSLMEKQ